MSMQKTKIVLGGLAKEREFVTYNQTLELVDMPRPNIYGQCYSRKGNSLKNKDGLVHIL